MPIVPNNSDKERPDMHTPARNHPLVLAAAVAVIIFSLLGSAAITGLIPAAHSERAEPVKAPAEITSSTETTDIQKKPQASSTSTKSSTKSQAGEPGSARTPDREKSSGTKVTKTAVCATCGVIESIRMVQQEGEGSGLGAVAGGVTGGLIGNQIGKGRGNTVMTILGVGGGAYAGHTIEKTIKSTTSYVIQVRMEDGSYRTVTKHSQPEYAVGDHVRVVSGNLKAA
jgi:outer membrane lipoprotein SlyB